MLIAIRLAALSGVVDIRKARFERNNHILSATVTAVVNQDTSIALPRAYGYLIRKKVHTNTYF
jgi:hypothetical protein